MIKPEMAPTVKVPAELAGGEGKAHGSGMSKSASPGLPTDPACPQPPVQPPARGSRALTQQGSPVVATPPPPQAVGNGNSDGNTKGATLLLRKGNASRSSPCRARCQAGKAARDNPLVPSSPGEGEGDSQRTCIPGPFPQEKPREGRGEKTPHTQFEPRFSGGKSHRWAQSSQREPAPSVLRNYVPKPGSGCARRRGAARSPHFWCARPLSL